jgi:hypothetical protein
LKKKLPPRGRGRKGKWAGLPAPIIAELMGCSVSTAKKELYKLPKPVTDLEMIGILVFEYRQRRDHRNLMKEIRKLEQEMRNLDRI